MPTFKLIFGEDMEATRTHAGQGPVLRGGSVIGDGYWRVRG